MLTVPRASLTIRVSRGSVVVTAVATVLTLAVAAASLTLGEFPITVRTVIEIAGGGGTLIEQDIVVHGRLPRAVTGAGVGVAFALSGAILQRIAGNPLVTPDVVGINSGAALGALFVITRIGGSGVTTIVGALLGAVGAAATIVVIAGRHRLGGFRLVLIGIGVAAMLTSAISFLLTRADMNEVTAASAWLSGSLSNRSHLHVTIVATTLLIAVPALCVLGRHLRLLELGDDLTRSLSGGAQGPRTSLLVVAVALAALATAAAGPIGFVALVAPQVTRRLLAERQVGLVPTAAVGALIVVCADLAARLLFAPVELPVGVLTTILGAPVLLYLLARAQRTGAAG